MKASAESAFKNDKNARVMGRPSWIIVTVICFWSALVSAGLFALWSYGAAPGEPGAPPSSWRVESSIERDGRFTLVFFAHPLCPCTRSSLAELARLIPLANDQLDAHVVFILPEGGDSSWHDSDLVSTAALYVPGVAVHCDVDRRETRLFNARTSGCCFLYDTNGDLVFEGGLTFARGHEGDNDGTRVILALLKGSKVDIGKTPAFGCPLLEPDAMGIQPNSSSR